MESLEQLEKIYTSQLDQVPAKDHAVPASTYMLILHRQAKVIDDCFGRLGVGWIHGNSKIIQIFIFVRAK